LFSCEEAYATWRSALTSEAFWKRKFQRNVISIKFKFILNVSLTCFIEFQVKSVPEWRKIWRKLNEHEKLKDVNYRSRCNIVIGHIEVNLNFINF
jgi:hypothetical protein